MKSPNCPTPVKSLCFLTVLYALSIGAAKAQDFNSSVPNSYNTTIDTTQFNVMTFSVKGAGGAGGGSDSARGGNGANGAQVTGLVQVGPPYSFVGITVAAGGEGALGGSGGTGGGTSDGSGGAGGGAGGNGGLNVRSGGGGGGGGASSINITGSSIWVRAGGGGGGGGGSSGNLSAVRVGYNGIGINADNRYAGTIDNSLNFSPANPTYSAVPLATLLATSNCQTAGAAVNGSSNTGANGHIRDGGGGGGNGGTYAGGEKSPASYGQDFYWSAEGGITGASCHFGATESSTLSYTGGAGSASSSGPSVASVSGGNGEVILTFAYDSARVPNINSINPNGSVTVTPPTTLPPGNTPLSYEVTCKSSNGSTLTGSAAAPGPVSVSGMSAGETYTCTTVAQLQDSNGPSIKTLPSPPFSISAPNISATADFSATQPGHPVTTDIVGNDLVTGTNIDLGNIIIVTPPVNGKAVVNSDGTITYTPNSGFSGTDNYRYKVCDVNMLCSEADVTIAIQASEASATPVPAVGNFILFLTSLLFLIIGANFIGFRRKPNN